MKGTRIGASVDRMVFKVPSRLKSGEKGHANRTSQESSKTSLTNFQTVPSSSPCPLFFPFSRPLSLSSQPPLCSLLFSPPTGSPVPLALVLAAIKSQFYTGGYPKLIASTRGAPLEWTPRNYVSTAVRGLYEPYKNGTTQPRRRSSTSRTGILRERGGDHDSGISSRTRLVTHEDQTRSLRIK